jgi:hypothetical protein
MSLKNVDFCSLFFQFTVYDNVSVNISLRHPVHDTTVSLLIFFRRRRKKKKNFLFTFSPSLTV